MIFICGSFINTIPNYDNFKDNWLDLGDENANFNKFNYTYYIYLQFINEQYRKLSDNRNLACIDLSIHLIILPTFILLSFIYLNCFICCKKDKIAFIIFEIISILIKGLCISDKLLFEMKKKYNFINYKL